MRRNPLGESRRMSRCGRLRVKITPRVAEVATVFNIPAGKLMHGILLRTGRGRLRSVSRTAEKNAKVGARQAVERGEEIGKALSGSGVAGRAGAMTAAQPLSDCCDDSQLSESRVGWGDPTTSLQSAGTAGFTLHSESCESSQQSESLRR